MAVKTQKPKAEEYLDRSNEICLRLFDRLPSKHTSLHLLGNRKGEENKFLKCRLEKLNFQLLKEEQAKSNYSNFINPKKNVLGIYLARKQRALVPKESASELLRIYHGGIFFDYTAIGNKIIELEEAFLEEELEEFKNKERVTLEDIRKFRYGRANKFTLSEITKFTNEEINSLTSQGSKKFIELDNLRHLYADKYGLFSIFMEKTLSDELGLESEFDKRYKKSTSPQIKKIIQHTRKHGAKVTFDSFIENLNNHFKNFQLKIA